ncbi:MAG: primosomal protein N' [Clostridia bacterium]|nr:primosomal protein N' [Clostridia bacterium]
MILEVIVNISNSDVDRTFDYEGDDVPIGSRVVVEFGKKRLIGFVIGKKEKSEFSDLKRAQYLDSPISPEQLGLMNFMRKTYNLRYIDVLRLFVPQQLREEKDPEYTRKFLTVDNSKSLDELKEIVGKRAEKQQLALDYIAANSGQFLSFLNAKFGVSAINGLREKNVVVESDVHERSTPLKTLQKEQKHVVLTSKQASAVDTFCSQKGTFLLHGVTGSGKTEVYECVIERMIEKGKTAIMLVPEISLTPQMLGLFRARFGNDVAILHSGLNASERYDEWKRLKTGKARIAIGARSAIFAPLENIGVIIIDEEHDTSYLSESNPRYDTKTVAEYRAKANDGLLILGSATPDMETYLKATNGEYGLVTLPERISKHKLPEMEIVDMTQEFRQGNRSLFSLALQEALKETVSKGEQAMLFLNRRGFASFIRCKECGYIAKCEDCDISLTYHKEDNELKCHYCGRRYHALTKCPNCGSHEIKQGRIGTEKVVEELKTLIPGVRVLRMDNDTTVRKDSYFKILSAFGNKEADVLVGTQMIAKGHDFGNVTLVGILEADAALYFSDYRSSERTFQLITQVAGRAGRAEKEGRVILQTYAPKHYVFRFGKTYDYIGFWKKEINTRMVTKFPPFTKVVRVLMSSVNEQDVVDVARNVYKGMQALQQDSGKFVYLGASKSPVTRMNGLCRYQVMARIEPKQFEQIIGDIYNIADTYKSKKCNVFVEINPQSLI